MSQHSASSGTLRAILEVFRTYIVNYKEREECEVTMPGSRKVIMRWLVGKMTGATTYSMRRFEIRPGGIIPLHTHVEEHQIFVLRGQAKALGFPEGTIAKKDDVVFIPSGVEHGYDNTKGKETFIFICVIPLLEQD